MWQHTCGGHTGARARARAGVLLPRLAHQSEKVKLLLSWPGAGVLVFWQLGALHELQRTHDLSGVPMLGSSSGALVTALAKGGACAQAAAAHGEALLQEFGVPRRAMGLIGILGRLTRRWLCDALPEHAADGCTGGAATLLVTTLPLLRTRPVNTFASRDDLISCVMASSHVPLVVDPRPFVFARWRPVIDGGIWWLLRRSTAEYTPAFAERSLLVTPFHDPRVLKELHLFRRMRPTDFGVPAELFELGREYARQLASGQGAEALAHVARPLPQGGASGGGGAAAASPSSAPQPVLLPGGGGAAGAAGVALP
ncbi:hypothetical protein Rsub_03073 [Raphidocelis subcapitata]|uniref:Patatin n=1 Tax=Raphidocelis subcapitata TaxID=307507 RepID=A0A2V0NVR9_9CHLO|nr:hypothetical protein Rsub_03073 [Raphidocelis subcapitata]|eukprot:GBF90772.1 hypothetical protein Rsub_03073 [Raphidocelis subcapitata]